MKFTIVTSTYNDVSALVHTASSLAAQTCRDFQWIIADGASTDGTVEYARSLGPLVATLSTERDTGIYNAWNRVLPLIAGEWVLFLGAGDVLRHDRVLEEVGARLERVDSCVTIAYGGVVLVARPGAESGVEIDHIWEGVGGRWTLGRPKLPCHQGVFHRATLFQSGFRYDESLRICADSELVLRELARGGGQHLDVSVSRFLEGGVSSRRDNRLQMVLEFVSINMKLGIFWERPAYQVGVIASNAAKHLLRRLRRRAGAVVDG